MLMISAMDLMAVGIYSKDQDYDVVYDVFSYGVHGDVFNYV